MLQVAFTGPWRCVRRAEPRLGDRVAVLGLRLLGEITIQMRPERVVRAQALGLDTGLAARWRARRAASVAASAAAL